MISFRTSGLIVILMFSLLIVRAETKLTYPQRQAVERQISNLKEVEKKMQAGASADEAKGLLLKLDNVIADLERNKCPDDNEQVANVKSRVKTARDALGKTVSNVGEKPKVAEPPVEKSDIEQPKEEAKSAGEMPPKETPSKEMPSKETQPAANDIKLTYQQRQAVDRQLGNLVELEAGVKEIEDQEPKIKYYPKPIEAGLGFSGKMESIINDLKKSGCPEGNSKVADIYQRIEKAKKTLGELEVKLKPKFELYDKYTNIANYPNYEKDLAQLKRLFTKYNNSERFYTNIERAKDLITGYIADAEFFNALGKTYAPIINFKTINGLNLQDSMKHAYKQITIFYEAKKAYAEVMPGEIDGHLKGASDMANQAFKDKKPAFFGGGVQQLMDKAQASIELFEVIKGEKEAIVLTYKEKYKKLKEEIATMEKSMEEEILASTQMPVEIYAGSDKEDLRSRIKAAWKKEYPNDEILKIVMHNENWSRNNKWTYNSAGSEWYQTDMSVITGLVIIKIDNKIAMQYPAFINKDHLSGDKITMGVGTKGSAYVSRKILVANVK
jgi:hypothetical protein